MVNKREQLAEDRIMTKRLILITKYIVRKPKILANGKDENKDYRSEGRKGVEGELTCTTCIGTINEYWNK